MLCGSLAGNFGGSLLGNLGGGFGAVFGCAAGFTGKLGFFVICFGCGVNFCFFVCLFWF